MVFLFSVMIVSSHIQMYGNIHKIRMAKHIKCIYCVTNSRVSHLNQSQLCIFHLKLSILKGKSQSQPSNLLQTRSLVAKLVTSVKS